MKAEVSIKISLTFENKSKASCSHYYFIEVNGKFFGRLRVSDHSSEKWKGFFHHVSNPQKITMENLVKAVTPQVKKAYMKQTYMQTIPLSDRIKKKTVRKFKK